MTKISGISTSSSSISDTDVFEKENGSGTSEKITGANLKSAIQGAMTYVGSASVAGSAATTLSLSGLDLNTDQRYFIRGSFHNATTSNATLSLYYNADTTATNYNRQVVTGSSSTVNGTRANDAAIATLDSNTASTGAGDVEIEGWITISRSGFVVANTQSVRTGNSNIAFQQIMTQWRTASTNVTGLTISSSVANSLDVGGVIEVWKLST